MTTSIHPVEQEEVMAFLDGELSRFRAAEVAAHVEQCEECQKLVLEFRGVSQKLTDWKVELPNTELVHPPKTEGRELRFPRWMEYSAVAAGILLLVVGGIRLIGTNANTVFSQVHTDETALTRTEQSKQFDRLETYAKLGGAKSASLSASPRSAGGLMGDSVQDRSLPVKSDPLKSEPMIVRTAELAVTVQVFDEARGGLEQILKIHRGYFDNLQITAPVGNPRTLAAKVRIPSEHLDAAIGELKKLGRVDVEAQTGQEVTAEYVDLQARLANARNTEQRLTEVLQQRTGKLADVLAVENEIARVRGEIESMEAERKTTATQVAFATLNLTLTEDYKAKLETVPPSTWKRFRNSAVEGYQSMTEGVVGLVVFVLSNGPSFLLWAALLFFPLRAVWRRVTAKVV